MEVILKFESLPNEILIECFEYLNAIDIFYAFDFLNSRLNNLIRNIPLYFNVEHIEKSMLVQFCRKIVLNSQMKKQFKSLTLSSKNELDTVEILLSFLLPDELSQLQSLTLNGVNREMVFRMPSMLRLLTNLRYFSFTGSFFGVDEIITSLPTLTIKTLSITHFATHLLSTPPFVSLVNLTISRCSVNELCHVFKYSPKLQYVRIEDIRSYNSTRIDELRLSTAHAVHLKRLVINNLKATFDYPELLLEQTPNLKNFMISADGDIEMIDAHRWQDLITTSLLLLDVFKFKFGLEFENEDSGLADKFQQFQSDFWQQLHHWHTEYTFNKLNALIYTVPYISNKYELRPYAKICYNALINNVNIFMNVTDLTLCPTAITDTYQHPFSNVKSLTLKNGSAHGNYVYPFKTEHIQCLETIVNLHNVTHLDILLGCRFESASIIIQLLEKAPDLSSLKIEQGTLISLFDNHKLYEYFGKMIKKLDVTILDSYTFFDSNEIIKLCQVFSNTEQFTCGVGLLDNFQLILNQLSTLSHMKVFFYRSDYAGSILDWLNYHASKLDVYLFKIKHASNDVYGFL